MARKTVKKKRYLLSLNEAIFKRIEYYANREGLGSGEAGRILIVKGLDAYGYHGGEHLKNRKSASA